MIPLLLACAPAPFAPDLSPWSGAERDCLTAACGAAGSAAELDSCRARACAARPAAWRVDPTLIRHEDRVVTMSVQVAHTPGGFGTVDAKREGDLWLGATVLTSTGEEIDLAVQTVFADHLDQPFIFSSEVGEDVQDVILGLWGKKVEPCDVARSGCRMFGFVLDDSLAAWPPLTYTESPPRRQRILPATMTLAMAGADPTAIRKVTEETTTRFGTLFTATSAAPGLPGVTHRHAHDGPLASRVAEVAGGSLPVRHDPEAAADITIIGR